MLIERRENLNIGATADISCVQTDSSLDSSIVLSADKHNEAKNMNKSVAFDSAFISLLLESVFGTEVLKASSVGGGKSHYNGVGHDCLDSMKLDFIRCMFLEGVNGDNTQAAKFNQFVNKKCNNLRRK